MAACAGSPGTSSSSSPSGGSGVDNPVGTKAPGFTIKNARDGGEAVTFTPAQKLTVLYFWATWSEPGKVGLVKMHELRLRIGDKNMDVIGISIDDEQKHVPEVIKNHGVTYPVGWDEAHKLGAIFTIHTEPLAIIVDAEGVIRHVHPGYHDGQDRKMESDIQKLIASAKH